MIHVQPINFEVSSGSRLAPKINFNANHPAVVDNLRKVFDRFRENRAQKISSAFSHFVVELITAV
jgi:hypothetical protein